MSFSFFFFFFFFFNKELNLTEIAKKIYLVFYLLSQLSSNCRLLESVKMLYFSRTFMTAISFQKQSTPLIMQLISKTMKAFLQTLKIYKTYNLKQNIFVYSKGECKTYYLVSCTTPKKMIIKKVSFNHLRKTLFYYTFLFILNLLVLSFKNCNC